MRRLWWSVLGLVALIGAPLVAQTQQQSVFLTPLTPVVGASCGSLQAGQVCDNRLTGQTAAVASVVTYTPTADGSFEVSANVLVTTATNHSFQVNVSYTDEGGTARNNVPLGYWNAGGSTGFLIVNAAGASPFPYFPLTIRAKANTAITISTAGTFTSVTYNVEGVIKAVR